LDDLAALARDGRVQGIANVRSWLFTATASLSRIWISFTAIVTRSIASVIS
jgi:hypothetical protein